jgi:hypothetical protein
VVTREPCNHDARKAEVSDSPGTERSKPHPAATKAQKDETAMLYVTDTTKDIETATRDLEAAVKRNKFGVLHVHNLQ